VEPSDLDPNPLVQLQHWIAAASAAGLAEPSAMVVATATRDGRPSSRTVLAKQVDADGIVFFTNYQSRKGRELLANPSVAATLAWPAIGLQVCVRGTAAPLDEPGSDRYFSTRDRLSQLGAWASPQSTPLLDRDELDARLAEVTARFDGLQVPRPPHWGGVRITPDEVELWVRGDARLHDRFGYERQRPGGWSVIRLAP
jgi:pyridoxamine 5'-phosphate oxidase